MNSPGILKRGYLYDKKVGLLPMTVDRKRWYILRQDPTQNQRVVLEFYKDEKSAAKGDAPKGFVNIRDVVAVQRLAEKKQSFEILCPGVGYRLMANSELEADEWAGAIRKHILYKREDNGVGGVSNGMKSLSLNRVPNVPDHTHITQGMLHDRQRAMSDAVLLGTPVPTQLHHAHHAHHHHQTPPTYHPHHHHAHHQLFQPESVPITFTAPPTTQPHPMPHPHRSPHMAETHSMVHLPPHGLPSPPEHALLSSPPQQGGFPANFHMPPGFQRQRSLEMAGPSSTSSDSSSMCSGSNASYEAPGGMFEADGMETKSTFRVTVKETENFNVSGPTDLVVSEDGIRLQSLPPDQQELVFWPLGSLRRYGANQHCFTIITGRFCATGEGRFQFYSDESRLIYAKVHSCASQKAASGGRGRSTPRRSSESDYGGGRSPQQTTPIHSINPAHSLPLSFHQSLPTSSSANQLPAFAQSNEDYSRLHHFLPPGSHRGGYAHTVTQPVSMATPRVLNQQQNVSPSNKNILSYMPHLPVTTSATANKAHSSSSNQSHSEDQNQSPPVDAMKSISSVSSLGSGESVGGASSGEASSGGASSRGGGATDEGPPSRPSSELEEKTLSDPMPSTS